MKKLLVRITVTVSILPSIFFLFIGLWLLIILLAGIQNVQSIGFVLFVLSIVAGGIYGIVGLIWLTSKVTSEEPMERMNRKLVVFLSLGIYSAFVSGFLFFFYNWMSSLVVLAPLGATSYLFILYRRKLECFS